MGLRARPVVSRHDQHRRIDLAGPDQHVADQPVVSRHVDEIEQPTIGRVRWAYPTSIVIPRRRSSGNRSASMPVSARSNVVLPWSMWPAVPTTTVIAASVAAGESAATCPRDAIARRAPPARVVGWIHRSKVEHNAATLEAPDHRPGPQPQP